LGWIGCSFPDIPVQTYTYKNVGQCEIKADVYRLHGKEVRPAILWIHSGALIMGDRNMLASPALKEQLRRYLNAGFAVISIDYRLAPETKLAGIVEDLKDAYRWMREVGPGQFYIDPDRIAIVGHSAGGYLTLMAGFSLYPRPKVLVSFYGYGDIIGEWYSQPDSHYIRMKVVAREDALATVGDRMISESPFPSKRNQFYVYCRQNGLWPNEVAGFDPVTQPKEFVPFCPILNIADDYPPTLLLHGDKDTDVPYAQSETMARALERHGITHRLIKMQNRGHVFDSAIETDRDVSDAFDVVLTFLREHVGSKQ
jgi:acetyl esterase/lipase